MFFSKAAEQTPYFLPTKHDCYSKILRQDFPITLYSLRTKCLDKIKQWQTKKKRFSFIMLQGNISCISSVQSKISLSRCDISLKKCYAEALGSSSDAVNHNVFYNSWEKKWYKWLIIYSL